MIDSMPATVIPHRGFVAIPHMGVGYSHHFGMRPRDILAANLVKLMGATELDTFPKITKAGGGSNGTLDRIRRKSVSTGIDALEPLAEAFGLQPWQLLVPNLNPKALPQIVGPEFVESMRAMLLSKTEDASVVVTSNTDDVSVKKSRPGRFPGQQIGTGSGQGDAGAVNQSRTVQKRRGRGGA